MEPQDYPICTACGSQYDPVGGGPPFGGDPSNCKICDDPRQFVPPSGQSWMTLREIKQGHHNQFIQDVEDKNLWFISTKPKFAIGQRAALLVTRRGNVLWDMVACLNGATIDFIKSKGRLDAIVISHPHYYTTYAEWAKAFDCPIIISKDDEEWLCRKLPTSDNAIEFLEGPTGTTREVVPGVTAIKAGGHFPGSLVLHWNSKLFIADTIVTVPSAYTPEPRPQGQTTFTFQWSIPNMIPLPPAEILKIWKAIEPFEFTTTHDAFLDVDVKDEKLKARLLESMKIQVRNEGYDKHELLRIEIEEDA